MRIQKVGLKGGLVAAGLASALASCSSNSSGPVTCASSAMCSGTSASTTSASTAAATPATLAAFTAPTDPGPGGVLFAASGEVLALTGTPSHQPVRAIRHSSTAGTCTSLACW